MVMHRSILLLGALLLALVGACESTQRVPGQSVTNRGGAFGGTDEASDSVVPINPTARGSANPNGPTSFVSASAKPSGSPASGAGKGDPAAPVDPKGSPKPVPAGVHAVEVLGAVPPALDLDVTFRTLRRGDGSEESQSTFEFNPNPPDAAITLAVAPGRESLTLKAFEITYIYTTPLRDGAGQAPLKLGPTRLAIPPLFLQRSPAGDRPGLPVTITVPVGSSVVRGLVADADPQKRPSEISARITFIDDGGAPLKNTGQEELAVTIPIRVTVTR